MTTAPTGRATKPTVYVLNARSVPTNGSNVGKNSLLKTSAAAVLYRKKSYHSIVGPTRLGNAMSPSELVLLLLNSSSGVPRSTRSIEPVPRGGLIVLPH